MAMVKADAYGHGMVETARIFSEAGCYAFGVAEINEGVSLRKGGIEGDIFVFLGFSSENVGLFFQYDLIPVVFDQTSIECISRAAREKERAISVHLKVDCGMGRLGEVAEEAEQLLKLINELPGIDLGGLSAHLPISEDPSLGTTNENLKRFSELIKILADKEKSVFHIANSGAVLNFPQSYYDMVRPGISLYGYYPDGEKKNGTDEDRLMPAMSFVSKVLQVKEVPEGYGISYGHTFITDKPTVLAVLPVGYEDGYLRALSNKAEVLIHGKRVPIRGRICMNLCMVDVTSLTDVKPGDEVVLLGSQGKETITADDIGRWAKTISYEILCLLGNNNERGYLNR